jgi:hypothetical protein
MKTEELESLLEQLKLVEKKKFEANKLKSESEKLMVEAITEEEDIRKKLSDLIHGSKLVHPKNRRSYVPLMALVEG